MTDGTAKRAIEAFAAHDAFEAGDRHGEGEFVATTTAFDARATVEKADDAPTRYRVVMRVPTLSAAVEEGVADVVEEGWFDTFALRLEDAAMAVPGNAEIAGPEADRDGERVVVTATIHGESADRAPRTGKALIDYVEGTYAEGVIPGYEYRPPVSDLLASARHDDSEADAGGPMPM